MRLKKNAIIISAYTAMIAVIVAALTFFLNGAECKILTFISNVTLGIFSSAIVTLLIFIYEYRLERRKAIFAFCTKVSEIDQLLAHIVFLQSENGSILPSYFERRRGKSVIDEQCEIYTSVSVVCKILPSLYDEIEFFTDISFCNWRKDRALKAVPQPQKLTRDEKKIARAQAKATYRDEYYSGKHKEQIYTRIMAPIKEIKEEIDSKLLNDARLYLKGYEEEYKHEVESDLLDLQDKFYEKNPSGSILRRPQKWKDAAIKLRKVLVGSKWFWLQNEG